jgi:hypothetical protein
MRKALVLSSLTLVVLAAVALVAQLATPSLADSGAASSVVPWTAEEAWADAEVPFTEQGCNASTTCPNACPSYIHCSGTYSCLVQPNQWIECDGNREYCGAPTCFTTCCWGYKDCDYYCGGIGDCVNGCCECVD